MQDVLRNLHERGHRDYFLLGIIYNFLSVYLFSIAIEILGDSGYPLRPWLLTPFEEEPAPGTPECRFNQSHKKTRSVIERCNGVLKARFRCCLKHRVLHYSPQKASKIINTCAVLHNICLHFNITFEDEDDDNQQDVDYGKIL